MRQWLSFQEHSRRGNAAFHPDCRVAPIREASLNPRRHRGGFLASDPGKGGLTLNIALVSTAVSLTQRPSKLSRSGAERLTEMTRQVALVRETRGERNFRQ
jgi:hypothetical protein